MVIKTKWGGGSNAEAHYTRRPWSGEGLDGVLMVEAGRQKRRTWTEYIRPSLVGQERLVLALRGPRGCHPDFAALCAVVERAVGEFTRVGTRIRGGPGGCLRGRTQLSFPVGGNDPEILDAEDDLTEEEFDRQYGAEFVERVGRVMQRLG
jgi:hypothetical protein